MPKARKSLIYVSIASLIAIISFAGGVFTEKIYPEIYTTMHDAVTGGYSKSEIVQQMEDFQDICFDAIMRDEKQKALEAEFIDIYPANSTASDTFRLEYNVMSINRFEEKGRTTKFLVMCFVGGLATLPKLIWGSP